jgi:putative transposase
MIDAVVALAPTPGLTASACAALNLSRASVYRQRRHLARPTAMPRPRPKPRRALDAAECQIVLNLLHAPRFADQAPAKGQLTLHADRGGPMRAKATALLLADLGVTKSHSRPHTSNDNPFSESHFKTMKYQPQFPQRFGCIQDAKTFCRGFFDWYNQDHHHAGIGLMTPDQVHYGQADQVHAARQVTLDGAFSRNPERFVRKEPEPPAKPIATWINPPNRQPTVQA